jgi:hypothetical protein
MLVPAMFWNWTVIRRAFFHSPFSPDSTSPTTVLKVWVRM